MIPKAALAILDVIDKHQEVTVETLVSETGYSRKQVYRAVDILVELDEISERRGSKQRRIFHPGTGNMMTAFQRLSLSAGHVDWRDILKPSLLRVCWYLDEPQKIATIAGRLGKTERAVYSALQPITDRAMLSPSGPKYALAENVSQLQGFADAFAYQSHRWRLRDIDSRGIIEWYEPLRVLVRSHTPEETARFESANGWQKTGVMALEEYGHRFHLPSEPLFWHGPEDELSPEQIVCHVIQSDLEPRRVSYAMLLIVDLELDLTVITELAKWYGVKDVIRDISMALEESGEWGESRRLPSRREFDQLKAQYGV
ncbi:helix-turn-helix domain-containing protein [Halostagnicola sp. A-GB9-2]|uniref:helix-turn-helix domain-containing protein n=1 Tax=Halostagnicola sp. A-GB9-2 TaxID=3048066 RepID=UPI0024BF7E51|nr:helix-turn-helix domain-containing protein [Halostagnicola sp. A-GB9-2]MDJ1434228.1 helix-turn-helix domain-containing protein [Halostagnicola sp. A-GB9-2]